MLPATSGNVAGNISSNILDYSIDYKNRSYFSGEDSEVILRHLYKQEETNSDNKKTDLKHLQLYGKKYKWKIENAICIINIIAEGRKNGDWWAKVSRRSDKIKPFELSLYLYKTFSLMKYFRGYIEACEIKNCEVNRCVEGCKKSNTAKVGNYSGEDSVSFDENSIFKSR